MPFDPEFIKAFASLGVGGGIACLVFYFYRKDALGYADVLKEQNVMLRDIVKDNAMALRENTASNARISTLIEALHARLLRAEQIGTSVR